MKKYFLLIALFSITFLGLGNYTNGQGFNSCGQAPNPTVASPGEIQTYNDCIAVQSTLPTTSTNSDSAAERNNNCNVTTITADNINHVQDNGPGGCCSLDGVTISGLSACTAAQMGSGNSCKPPVGGVSNGIVCTCPDGTKNVDGICTSCKIKGVCCGIELNTSVPFIGKCIEDSSANRGSDETSVTGATAFPTLMGSLTKILVTLILITSFVLIIIGGIMIATGNPSGGRKMIMNVVIGIALLGASGVILRLINPNFFG